MAETQAFSPSPLGLARWLAAIDGAPEEAALAAVLASAQASAGLTTVDWDKLAAAAFEKHLVLIAERDLPETERLTQLLALAESLGESPAGEPLGLVLELAGDLGGGTALLPLIAMACRHVDRLPIIADQVKLLWHRAINTTPVGEMAQVAALARALAVPAFAELAEARCGTPFGR